MIEPEAQSAQALESNRREEGPTGACVPPTAAPA